MFVAISLWNFVFYTCIAVGMIPILVLKRKGVVTTAETRYIEPFLWLIVISNIYEVICTRILYINSAAWFRLYLILEFLVVAHYFYRLLGRRCTAFFVSAAAVFIIAFIILGIYWKTIDSFMGDAVLSVIEIIFVYVCSIMWFKDIFINVEEDSLLQSPSFFFVSGFVIYLSGTIFLFLMANMLRKTESVDFQSIWMLNIIFNIILRILLIIGIWKGQRKLTR